MKYVVSEAHENIFHSLFKSRSFRARKLRNMDSYEHGKKGLQAASELDSRSKCERTPKPTINTAKRGKVMRYQIFLAALALWILTGVTALANPALMQKSKPGYPYPGTTQITIFGEEAIEKSILNENLQAGEVPDQASRGSETRGKLLPTDDSQLSPHPELDTMPSEKSKTRVN